MRTGRFAVAAWPGIKGGQKGEEKGKGVGEIKAGLISLEKGLFLKVSNWLHEILFYLPFT